MTYYEGFASLRIIKIRLFIISGSMPISMLIIRCSTCEKGWIAIFIKLINFLNFGFNITSRHMLIIEGSCYFLGLNGHRFRDILRHLRFRHFLLLLLYLFRHLSLNLIRVERQRIMHSTSTCTATRLWDITRLHWDCLVIVFVTQIERIFELRFCYRRGKVLFVFCIFFLIGVTCYYMIIREKMIDTS